MGFMLVAPAGPVRGASSAAEVRAARLAAERAAGKRPGSQTAQIGLAEAYYRSARDALDAWVRSGGTLIALGNSSATLADEELDLSSVRRRRDVLEQLDAYAFLAQRERDAREVELDLAAIWGDDTEAQAPREALCDDQDD